MKHLPSQSIGQELRNVMKTVPSPVVVITTAKDGKKRGITCSSFTSVSLDPPIVSFCIRLPSRMSELLHERSRFGVHVLSRHQVAQSIIFSTPDKGHEFDQVPHYLDDDGIPVLIGCVGVMHCEKHQVLSVGDHEVWFAKVLQVDEGVGARERELPPPLLYYMGKYRDVGEEVFMAAFEDTTLDFNDWTHRNHLRLAFNYMRSYGPEEAKPLIRDGIKRYILANKSHFPRSFNTTITEFWVNVIVVALQADNQDERGPSKSFWEFLERWPQLDNRRLINHFYSKSKLETEEARRKVIKADLTQCNEEEILKVLKQ